MAEPDETYGTYEPELPKELSEPDEGDEPVRPRPVAIPPLPRLWKAEAEPVADEVPTPAKAGRKKRFSGPVDARKKQPADAAEDDGTGATKLAETPVLDTYEARQRARWIFGGVLGLVGTVALILVVRAFRGVEPEPKEAVENREVGVAAETRAKSEQEAQALVEIARQADKAGKTRAAVDSLVKVAKNYQGTPSARLAMVAIARNQKNLSLFGTEGEDHPTGPKPPTPAPVATTAPPSPPKPATPRPKGPAPGVAVALGPAPPKEVIAPIAPAPGGPIAPDPTSPTPGQVASKTPPIGFTARPGAPVHASGWPTEIVCNRDGAVMVLVPGSTFLMGREDGEAAERPSHLVKVSTFYIDRQEVTARQFEQFLKDTGRPLDALKVQAKNAPAASKPSELPATGMTAREALEYCKWARRKLPTEAQWEFAARSPSGLISYWNGKLPREDPPQGARPMEPVGSLSTDLSPYGVLDLGANAWEWTGDWYDSQYYQQVKNGIADPTGPASSRVRPAQVTVRGGSKDGILTWREGLRMESRLPYLGFRGALAVEGAPVAPAAANPAAAAGHPILPGGVPPP